MGSRSVTLCDNGWDVQNIVTSSNNFIFHTNIGLMLILLISDSKINDNNAETEFLI